MTAVLLLVIAVIFVMAFIFYGRLLEKIWRIEPQRQTPAHTEYDASDYMPTKAPIVFGHHFASIAGAAPIIGPIAALVFGWLPVLLWIVIAGIFIGSVHDFGALLASIRHKGKNLGVVIGENAGQQAKKLFSAFVWLTSILVIAAFTSIVADTFIQMPAAATASTAFVLVAIFFGVLYNKWQVPFAVATIIALVLMAASIWLGLVAPLHLSKNMWMLLITAYIAISSVTPVWVLLQPRDYLNSFLLYLLVILAALALFFVNPQLNAPIFTHFTVNKQQLFPILFVMVACGAISGYHAMFASTTTSKQVDNERHIKPIAFGAMLVESFLAIIALLVAASLTSTHFNELYQQGGPIAIFSKGIGGLLYQLGLPVNVAESFVVLAISSFALTSLDSVARVARSILQDYAQQNSLSQATAIQRLLQNKYIATLITIIVGGMAAFTKWQVIWPVFGCANQLIAALVFVILLIWLKKTNRPYKIIIAPLVLMLLVTFSALIKLTISSVQSGNFILAGVTILLMLTTVLFGKSVWKEIVSVDGKIS